MKPRVQDVIETVMASIGTALANAKVPAFGQIVVGQPVGTALLQIMGQSTEQGLISVFPRPGSARDITCYQMGTTVEIASNPAVPLSATVVPSGSHWTITFLGSVVAGINIHTLLGIPLVDAFYQTVASDSLTTVAIAVSIAINALGYTATPSANTVVVTGSPLLICNIGGSSTTARLVGRTSQTIQISIWVPDPHANPPAVPAPLRYLIAEAITSSIGTVENRSLSMSAGPPMDIDYVTEYVDDQAQSEYSTYAYHLAYHVEYDILRYVQSTQIGAVETAIEYDNGPTVTLIGG